jgi:hypothetical protein
VTPTAVLGKILSWLLEPVAGLVARILHGWDWEQAEDLDGS